MPQSRWFLRAAALSGAAAIAALESGWVVTEVGRQPWIVYGFLRTEDAVTNVGDLWISLTIVVVLYTVLAFVSILVVRSMAARWRRADLEGGDVLEEQGPYAPRPAARDMTPGEPEPAGPRATR
jgi:cytochrome d ubiquinol oxidase subunit I